MLLVRGRLMLAGVAKRSTPQATTTCIKSGRVEANTHSHTARTSAAKKLVSLQSAHGIDRWLSCASAHLCIARPSPAEQHKSDASMGMRYDRCNAYLRARGYGSDLETVIR